MTPQAMNIAAAEECGWKAIQCGENSLTPGKWRIVPPQANAIVAERFDTKEQAFDWAPYYYHSADAALELCEVVRNEGFDVEISRFSFHTRDWFVAFECGKVTIEARNPSLPAAITEAFLKWKGKL